MGKLDELVSDWELEEIRQELKSGDAPDVVAFRHGVPLGAVRGYGKGHVRHIRKPDELWTDAEKAFVKDNYPNHGEDWVGWEIIGRTWGAIRKYAHRLGIRRKRSR